MIRLAILFLLSMTVSLATVAKTPTPEDAAIEKIASGKLAEIRTGVHELIGFYESAEESRRKITAKTEATIRRLLSSHNEEIALEAIRFLKQARFEHDRTEIDLLKTALENDFMIVRDEISSRFRDPKLDLTKEDVEFLKKALAAEPPGIFLIKMNLKLAIEDHTERIQNPAPPVRCEKVY